MSCSVRKKWHGQKNMSPGQQNIGRKSFSDETRISVYTVFGSDGVRYVRRQPWGDCLTERLTPTMKHPLRVMIWGCISRKGVDRIQVLEGNINPAGTSKKYWSQRCCPLPVICLVLVTTSYFSRMEHHATQLVSVPDGSSNTMSSCLLGLETVQTSTLLRICGHDWRGWWCRSDRATRPAPYWSNRQLVVPGYFFCWVGDSCGLDA